ncbi:MAG: SsrA-binding protein SmpB [Patescibacteria group bacterium]|nr:SsrA-binding protein SmpB [Patescibacteria group bacterium]
MPPALCHNKKALHDYEVLEKLVAGIVLKGYEIKALRNNQGNLKGSYISLKSGEAWTKGLHISPYKHASVKDYDPKAPRKLLLTKKEIQKLTSAESQKGTTIVPLDIHLKNNRAKMTIGICRGKKLHDKRADLKKRAQDKEIRQTLKNLR